MDSHSKRDKNLRKILNMDPHKRANHKEQGSSINKRSTKNDFPSIKTEHSIESQKTLKLSINKLCRPQRQTSKDTSRNSLRLKGIKQTDKSEVKLFDQRLNLPNQYMDETFENINKQNSSGLQSLNGEAKTLRNDAKMMNYESLARLLTNIEKKNGHPTTNIKNLKQHTKLLFQKQTNKQNSPTKQEVISSFEYNPYQELKMLRQQNKCLRKISSTILEENQTLKIRMGTMQTLHAKQKQLLTKQIDFLKQLKGIENQIRIPHAYSQPHKDKVTMQYTVIQQANSQLETDSKAGDSKHSENNTTSSYFCKNTDDFKMVKYQNSKLNFVKKQVQTHGVELKRQQSGPEQICRQSKVEYSNISELQVQSYI